MNSSTKHIPQTRLRNAPYIFISYSHLDRDIVRNQIDFINNNHFPVWYDQGIYPGREWPDETGKALAECKIFLVFITPNSANSDQVKKEIHYAIKKRKILIAIHLLETELPLGLDFQLNNVQALFKYKMSSEKYKTKLLKVLGRALINATKQTTIKNTIKSVSTLFSREQPRVETNKDSPKEEAKSPKSDSGLSLAEENGELYKSEKASRLTLLIFIAVFLIFVAYVFSPSFFTASTELRSQPRLLSGPVIQQIIKDRGYFCRGEWSNPDGKGWVNHFLVLDSESVLDKSTGLIWQSQGSGRRTYNSQENLTNSGSSKKWRIPTLDEALSLMEPVKGSKKMLYIDDVFGRVQRSIWTSDKDINGNMWVVDFRNGVYLPVSENSSYTLHYFRLVRSSD